MTLAAAKTAFPVGTTVESTYPGSKGEKGEVVGYGSVAHEGCKTPTMAVVLVQMTDEGETTQAFAPMFLALVEKEA